MKYIYYISVLLFELFRKVFGLGWYYVAVRYRSWARRCVYSYVLENNLYIKRLYERPISDGSNIKIIAPYHGATGGIFFVKKVSKLKFLFAYWFVWGWIDDDSNYDTTDLVFLKNIVAGKHMPVLGFIFRKHIKKQIKYIEENIKYGNTFDLGELRELSQYYDFICSSLWNIRNTSYNFKYMQFETQDENKVFQFKLFNRIFGWKKEDIINNKQNYTLVFCEKTL